jgi:hypothetical protein
LSDWEFQTSEPTLWSEYRIKTPQIFGYAGLSQGYEQFFINTNEQLKETFNTPNGPQIINVASARWVMKDVPAIRDEPFITTVDDYRAKVMFQLASVTWPGDRTRQILETWEKVAEELWEYSKFGDQLNQNGDVGKQAEFVTRGIEDSLQKAIALYDYVRNTVVWNKERRFTVDEDLDEVLELKTGSSAEINLLLTSMLRRAGLRANPVLLSTRNNGRIQKAYPILSQFDYVIASVKVGQRDYLLDATDRERPFHLLPQRVLNHHGLSIDGGRCSWTAIEPSAKARSATVATLELDNEGLLKGLIRRAFFDYSAFVQRQDLSGKQADDYVRSLLRSETTGLSVDSFAIHNKESVRDSLVVEAWVSSPTVSQVLDNFIYMNPHFLDRTSENPLKLTKRNFPVDFAYLKESSCTLRLTLPGGYELKECPKDRSVQLPSNGGTYKRRAQCSEGTFQLLTRYELNKTVFEPAQYRALRAFYDQMVITESEQIVLQMKHSNDRVK